MSSNIKDIYQKRRDKIEQAIKDNPNISEDELVNLIYGEGDHGRLRGGYVSAIRKTIKYLNNLRNPMTTTAEEKLLKEVHDIVDKVHTKELSAEQAKIKIEALCDKFNELEKLREAEEVSDEDIWKDAMTNCKHSGVDGNDSGVAFDNYVLGSKAMRSKLSPKIAQLQAEKEVLKEELSGGVHSCPPNCQNPTCIIRRERDQLKAEKERMVGVLKKIGKIHSESVSAQLANEALASLPEEK